MNYFKKFFIKDKSLIIFDQAIVSGSNFILGILIARFLGITEFGVFTLIWMVIMFINSIQLSFIINPMMTFSHKQNKYKRKYFFSSLFILQIAFSLLSVLLTMIGLIIINYFYPELNLRGFSIYFIIVLFFTQIQDFIRRFFFVENKIEKALFSDFITYILRLIFLLILFYFYKPSLEIVFLSIILSLLISIIYSIFSYNFLQYFNLKKKNYLIKVFIENWNFSKWLVASSVFLWTSGNYFIIVAGVILGPFSVGVIKAMQNIVGISHILFQAFENFVPIDASKIFLKNKLKGLNQYLLKFTLFGGIGLIFLFSLIYIFSENLILLLYGDKYIQYVNILNLYLIVYILNFLAIPLTIGLRTIEYTKPVFLSYIITTILSFMLANKFVDNFNLNGILYGIIIVQMTRVLILFLSYKKGRFKK